MALYVYSPFYLWHQVNQATKPIPGTGYIEAIFIFSMFALSFFALPETYPPVLLKRKARLMRESTGDPRHWHPLEEERVDRNTLNKYVGRPIR